MARYDLRTRFAFRRPMQSTQNDLQFVIIWGRVAGTLSSYHIPNNFGAPFYIRFARGADCFMRIGLLTERQLQQAYWHQALVFSEASDAKPISII